MTCRLAEKGHRVCLLERGQRYGMHAFPRRMGEMRDRLFWDPRDQKFGFMEFRAYPESDVFSVSASGLGGGSLIYANVLMPMPAEHFIGWPGGITRETLDPHYARALNMLEAAPYPIERDFYRDTPKAHAFQKAAARLQPSPDAIGSPEFVFPHLAVRFQGDFPGEQSPNNQGVIQSSCIKCGECDIGCNIHAKNTLDLNYLARAINTNRMGAGSVAAEIKTHAQVDAIIPLYNEADANTRNSANNAVDSTNTINSNNESDSGRASGSNNASASNQVPPIGYRVEFHNPLQPGQTHSFTARRVVVSAGSIGSTGLLLRMQRDGHLPHCSALLGRRWCGNGDLEGTALMVKDDVDPTNGPVITGAVRYRFENYPDGFPHGLVLQEAGVPNFLTWFVGGRLPSPRALGRIVKFISRVAHNLIRNILSRLRIFRFKDEINYGDDVARLFEANEYINRTVVLLGMGRDRNDGRIELRDDGEPIIRWKMKNSRLHYKRVRREMQKMAVALGGRFMDNPLTYMNRIIAVHPLGGCVMGDSPAEGVVNTRGEVFGHPGLYVVDASILPSSVGPNPSLTITALAEYIAAQFPAPE
ncbi:MAG: GMC family oxidoreductase [Leptospiraceae bacterium]|nr:GMC family oxidoreductase [Leptospiraceae bacterium]